MRLDRIHPAATDMEKELCHLVLFLLPQVRWENTPGGRISPEAAQVVEIQIRNKVLEALGMSRYNYATSSVEDLAKRGR